MLTISVLLVAHPADKSRRTLYETTVGVLARNLRTEHSSLLRSRITSGTTTGTGGSRICGA